MKTTSEIYNRLFNSVSHLVKNYRTDLEIHDKNEIEKNEGTPFLHWTVKAALISPFSI